MWNNSTLEDPYSSLGNAEDHGWIKEEGMYKFDWETEVVAQQITEIIQFLTKGCSCKQGCTNMRCGCMKRGTFCGPGCDCRGCINVAARRGSIATANVRTRVVNSPLRTTAFTSSHLDVLNKSDQSEKDDELEEDDTGDTEEGEWDDYSLDSEQSDIECEVVTDAMTISCISCLHTAISETQHLCNMYPVIA